MRSQSPVENRKEFLWLGRRLARVGVLLLACASLSGCVCALGGAHHVSGAALPLVIPHFAPGTPEEKVAAALGAPSSRQTVGGDERLTWSEVLRPKGCRIYLFGLIPLNREPRRMRDVVVTIRQGAVQQAVLRTRDRSGRTDEQPLLDLDASR